MEPLERVKELESQLDELSTIAAGQIYDIIQVLSLLTTTHEKYYEGSHSKFVAQKSVGIARELSLNDEQIFEIETAALLHDIGKIGFPESILSKFASELKPHEYAQYQTHPYIGYKLLNKIPAFENISKIILQHHERLDGSGFPNKLQGKEIIPGAAIIAVTDTFHSMFYRTKKDKTTPAGAQIPNANTASLIEGTQAKFSNAMNYLHFRSGQLFDTRVVSIFTDLIEDERKAIGASSILRIALNKVEPGWIIAEDYNTNYGMLIAAKGEIITPSILKTLLRLAENGEMPMKILVMKP
jgi:putative nucleotidyltransferase with HDIG domain